MEPRERRILIVTSFGHFLSHFNMLVFPAVVLPLVSRLGMDMADVLRLSFWMYLCFGLSAMPWGLVGDRWNAVRLMRLFFLGAGLCGLASAYWMDHPAVFAASLAGVGLFSGIYHPIGLGMITKGVKRMSVALGYNGMFGSLALVLAPFIGGLLNWGWGPRAVFWFMGGLNLLGLLLMVSHTSDDAEEERSSAGTGERNYIGPFLCLLGAVMLAGIAYRGATVILPAYLELKNKGLLDALTGMLGWVPSGNLVATIMAAFIYLPGILAQYVGGRVAERFNTGYSYLTAHLLSIPAVLLIARMQDLSLLFVALIYFFFLMGMQPIENTLVARFTPKRFHHSAFGFKFVLTFGVGALAVRLVAGIEGRFGIEAVFTVLGIVTAMIVVFIVGMIRVSRGSNTVSQSKV